MKGASLRTHRTQLYCSAQTGSRAEFWCPRCLILPVSRPQREDWGGGLELVAACHQFTYTKHETMQVRLHGCLPSPIHDLYASKHQKRKCQ